MFRDHCTIGIDVDPLVSLATNNHLPSLTTMWLKLQFPNHQAFLQTSVQPMGKTIHWSMNCFPHDHRPIHWQTPWQTLTTGLWNHRNACTCRQEMQPILQGTLVSKTLSSISSTHILVHETKQIQNTPWLKGNPGGNSGTAQDSHANKQFLAYSASYDLHKQTKFHGRQQQAAQKCDKIPNLTYTSSWSHQWQTRQDTNITPQECKRKPVMICAHQVMWDTAS